jgi:hypothetical protein
MVMLDESIPKATKTFDRLEYWYWGSVLSNVYTARQNEHCVLDISQLRRWLRNPAAGNPFENRAAEALNSPRYSDKDALLRRGDDDASIGTDVGAYLIQLVAALGGQDPLEHRRIHVDRDEVEDHHLIPLGSVANVGQSTREIRRGATELHRVLNSPLNRAYVLKATNRELAAKAIDKYMESVPGSVQASLHFSGDPFQRTQGEAELDWVRRVLENRFDNIRTAFTNRMTNLIS